MYFQEDHDDNGDQTNDQIRHSIELLTNQKSSLDQITDAILAASTADISETVPTISYDMNSDNESDGIDKLAMSEIEKFRSRQAMRDKELELKRQEKLKEKIIHYEKMKQKGDTASSAALIPPPPVTAAPSAPSEVRRR